jgi:hypothetical protein
MDDRGRGLITFREIVLQEHQMPGLNVSEKTFRLLAAKAASLQISVEELVQPALDRLAEGSPSAAEQLTGDNWQAELDAWKHDVQNRAGRYPSGFIFDDSREAAYREREDAQR